MRHISAYLLKVNIIGIMKSKLQQLWKWFFLLDLNYDVKFARFCVWFGRAFLTLFSILLIANVLWFREPLVLVQGIVGASLFVFIWRFLLRFQAEQHGWKVVDRSNSERAT